jgi:hypothetical protein
LLELEFLNPRFVRGDRCAFYADVVFEYGVCSVNGDLVISLQEVVCRVCASKTGGTYVISVFEAQIEILDVQLQVRED